MDLAIAGYTGDDPQVRLLARRYKKEAVDRSDKRVFQRLIDHKAPCRIAISVYWEVVEELNGELP